MGGRQVHQPAGLEGSAGSDLPVGISRTAGPGPVVLGYDMALWSEAYPDRQTWEVEDNIVACMVCGTSACRGMFTCTACWHPFVYIESHTTMPVVSVPGAVDASTGGSQRAFPSAELMPLLASIQAESALGLAVVRGRISRRPPTRYPGSRSRGRVGGTTLASAGATFRRNAAANVADACVHGKQLARPLEW